MPTFLATTSLVVPLSVILAQTVPSDPSGGWTDIVSVYGPFAPFALGTIVIIKVLWDRLKSVEDELRRAQESATTNVVPALIESNRLHAETADAMSHAVVMMHQLAGRPGVDPEMWRRVLNALDRAENRERGS